MKKYILFLLFFACSNSMIFAQNLVAERISDLMPQIYSISGQASLNEYDNGLLQLKLSSDFDTPAGPDVRILLGNSLSLSNAVEIVNLSDIFHFSGEITVDVPSDVNIDDFQYILFYCVQFQQFWASGEFGATTFIGGASCDASTISSNNGNMIDICSTDGTANIINFSNSLSTAAGDNYAYLITDENEILQEVVLNGFYDFEGSGNDVQRVYGLSYDGQLAPVIGANRTETTASDCFIHSDGNTFLTITKDACIAGYQCSETITATTDWVVEVNICPTDGIADEVELRNNLFITAGQNYAYLITDENQIVQEAVLDSMYNFEGSGTEAQRIYGINYDGTLNVAIGQHRSMTTATGCFTHSGDNIFLTVLKNGCAPDCLESAVATHNWILVEDICSTDGDIDEVFIQNNISDSTILGVNYAFLLTDANEILQEVITVSTYNFEGTGIEEQRVYGISYSGVLDAKIGQTRKNTTASDCFIHSSDNLFLTINKVTACATPVINTEFSKLVEIFPNPATDFLTIKLPNAFVPEQISIINMLGTKVVSQSLSTNDNIELNIQHLNSGNYIVRIENENDVVNQMIQIVK